MKLGFRVAMRTNGAQALSCRRAAGVARLGWTRGKAKWDADYRLAKAETDKDRRKALMPSAGRLRAGWNAVRRQLFPFTYDVTKCAGAQAILDLASTYGRAARECADAKRDGRKPRKMFGFPKFKAKSKTMSSFRVWNDQFSITNHYSAVGKAHATVTLPHIGEIRLVEAVPCVGGILAATVSHRRGRWFVAFQYDTDRLDGEVSVKAAAQRQSHLRNVAVEAWALDGLPDHAAKARAAAWLVVEPTAVCRVQALHPRPGTVGGGDVGLISAMAMRTLKTFADGTGEPDDVDELRVDNPRRLGVAAGQAKAEPKAKRPKRAKVSQAGRRALARGRNERKLSKSILRARVKAAEAAKAKQGDAAPLTAADLKGVRVKNSNRQWRRIRKGPSRVGGRAVVAHVVWSGNSLRLSAAARKGSPEERRGGEPEPARRVRVAAVEAAGNGRDVGKLFAEAVDRLRVDPRRASGGPRGAWKII